MTSIPPVEVSRFTHDQDFVATTDRKDLLFFVLNVGDADCQLVVLPEGPDGQRRAIVVDVADERKLSALITDLAGHGLLTSEARRLSVVVATHPHDDHIAGMPAFLALHAEDIVEFWEPGFLGTIPSFHEMMVALERSQIPRRRPTAGHVAVISNARVSVLAPSLRLRQQFLTHGINENNASVALRIDVPAARVARVGGVRRLVESTRASSLLLGADAQFEAWAHVLTDFPHVIVEGEERRKAVKSLLGPDLLQAQIFKVPHHASKHGVTVELAKRVAALTTVVSCADGAAPHQFPHEIARAALRDARGKTLDDPEPDDELDIHYTGASDSNGTGLGSICVRVRRGTRQVWRFRDLVHEDVQLAAGVQYA